MDTKTPTTTPPTPTLLDQALPWLMIGFAGILWGLTFSIGKILVESGVRPLGISFTQSILNAVLVGVIVFARKRPLLPALSQPKTLGIVFVMAFLAFVFPSSSIYFSSQHLPAGIITIMVALAPMFTYGLSIPLGMERFGWRRMGGLLLGLAAIGLIVLPEGSLPGREVTVWVLLVAVAALSYAMQTILLGSRFVTDLGFLRTSFCIYVAGAILLLIPVWATGSFVVPTWPLADHHYLIMGLSCATVSAFMCFFYVIRNHGPVFASQTGYIVTITGVFWGMLIFSESHSLWIWLALAVMLCGLALVRPGRGG